ncbi:hypothetical protein P3T39_002380 [Kitasatospora sp. GP82]|nr:hypothetical protein [Kitasatospora sp. GP82]
MARRSGGRRCGRHRATAAPEYLAAVDSGHVAVGRPATKRVCAHSGPTQKQGATTHQARLGLCEEAAARVDAAARVLPLLATVAPATLATLVATLAVLTTATLVPTLATLATTLLATVAFATPLVVAARYGGEGEEAPTCVDTTVRAFAVAAPVLAALVVPVLVLAALLVAALLVAALASLVSLALASLVSLAVVAARYSGEGEEAAARVDAAARAFAVATAPVALATALVALAATLAATALVALAATLAATALVALATATVALATALVALAPLVAVPLAALLGCGVGLPVGLGGIVCERGGGSGQDE